MREPKTQASQPKTGASVALICGDEVLLIARGHAPFKGAWSLPGGGQEIGETLDQTARRELIEETGVILDNLQFAFMHKVKDAKIHTRYQLAVYYAQLAQKPEVIPSSDATDAQWVTLDRISALETTPKLGEIVGQLYKCDKTNT